MDQKKAQCSNGFFIGATHYVHCPEDGFITKEEWDKKMESKENDRLSKASMSSLAEEFVDQILSAAHYETMGDAETRVHCRAEAISILTEILSRRVSVSTSINLFDKD